MSKIIVIDWGSQHVRLLEGETRGSRVHVHKLSTLVLPEGQESGESDAARGLVQQALQAHGGSGAKIIGLVGRSQAVLRDLRLPNAPPEEMPAIVQLQAMRELSFPVEQAAIDYEIVGPPDDDGQRRVILVALQQDVIERYRGAVSSSKLELSRLGLRPYATWRAYRQVSVTPDEAVLVISLAGETLELTVARGESVLFSRATLLRGAGDAKEGASEPTPALAPEVRRTLAAFANQMPGTDVKRIALAAGRDEHQSLGDALAEALSIPVDRFDPFQCVELSREVQSGQGEFASDRGSFVAAIGAAISVGEYWPIDFLNPKKPVVQRDRRKPIAVLAAAAAVLILGASYFMAHIKIARGKQQIQTLTKLLADRQDKLKPANETLRKYQAVEQWTKSELNCLEYLQRVTEEFPDTKEMYTKELDIKPDNLPDGRVKIMLDGVAKQTSSISQFHTKLNAGDTFTAQPALGVVPPSKGEYRNGFKAILVVKQKASEDGSNPRESSTKPDADEGTTAKKSGSAAQEPTVVPVSNKAGEPRVKQAAIKN